MDIIEYLKNNKHELDSLCKRLQNNYNNDTAFEQAEEDRLIIYNILEMLETGE